MATKNTTENTSLTTKGREFRGTVVSNKMKDTIAVVVERYVKHPKYKKFLRRTKKFLAHDEGNTYQEGDKVTIREVKPLSKKKHFEVVADNSQTDNA